MVVLEVGKHLMNMLIHHVVELAYVLFDFLNWLFPVLFFFAQNILSGGGWTEVIVQ